MTNLHLPRLSVALALVGCSALAVHADDRALLRTASEAPYVFVILDTSGSMNWTTKCTQADFDAGNCDQVCLTKDCMAPLHMDDPASKLYQARQALYTVIEETPNVKWGFANFNSDRHEVEEKHYLYQYETVQVETPWTLNGGLFPTPSVLQVLGPDWSCTAGSSRGCWNNGVDGSVNGNLLNSPARINQTNKWESNRAGRIPKGGAALTGTTVIYIDSGTTRYKVSVTPTIVTGTLSDTAVPLYRSGPTRVRLAFRLERCGTGGSDNGDRTRDGVTYRCATRTDLGTKAFTYSLISDFVAWDFDVNGTTIDQSNGYFGDQRDIENANTCSGWEPNTDNNDICTDCSPDYNAKYPTRNDTDLSILAGLRPRLSYGDMVPLDWRSADGNKANVLARLAPNLKIPAEAALAPCGDPPVQPCFSPDFRVARYYRNQRCTSSATPGCEGNSEAYHRLRQTGWTLPPPNPRTGNPDLHIAPPVAHGSTPLGNSLRDFRAWYAGCTSGTCSPDTGWRHAAARYDTDWGCRKTFVLVLTDGDDTCGGADACSEAGSLLSRENVKTYVVAFGDPDTSGNKLDCMAEEGGTGAPFAASNRDALVQQLRRILGDIQEDVRAFASAAVPSTQAQVTDKTFLTTFRPLNDESIWPGQVDSYLKPLPVDAEGLPDDSIQCTDDVQSACHAWDAAEVMLGPETFVGRTDPPPPLGDRQAPRASDLLGAINASTLQIGTGSDERRVHYPMAIDGDKVPRVRRDLVPQSDLTLQQDQWRGFGLSVATPTPSQNTAVATIKHTLVIKEGETEDAAGAPVTIPYILGDIFHSDPVVAGAPTNFLYFSPNLYSNGKRCDDDVDPNPGYRCFVERHFWRRKMLLLASNDGQLHAFDAGKFNADDSASTGNLLIGTYDAGTGQEIFSWVPRLTMPKLKQYAETTEHDWSLDGTVRIDDVFMDPVHSGTPVAAEREWRTVVIGGQREGGYGYYALDITQPDTFQGFQEPQYTNGYVPSCSSGSSSECAALRSDDIIAFPSGMWEITDTWDEDNNGNADLGETWSVPNTGRIRVTEAGVAVDKFVAVFGGGMDPDKCTNAATCRGDWLYMVDIETGKVIYKQAIEGAAPSDPAAVDTNQDGYLDTIYIGTTLGFVYKAYLGGNPALATVTVFDYSSGAAVAKSVKRITAAGASPVKIFDTGGRPIYYPPSIIFITELSRYAIAFGTGEREDLWATDVVAEGEGRFYMVVDTGFTAATAGLPRTESTLEQISLGSLNRPNENFLLRPASGLNGGWYIPLLPKERVITKPLGIAGIVIFSTYIPDIRFVPAGDDDDDDDDEDTVCARTGESRVYVLLTTNADSVISTSANVGGGGADGDSNGNGVDDCAEDLDGNGVFDCDEGDGSSNELVSARFWKVPDFVTQPYVEPGQTKNQWRPGADGDNPDENASALTPDLERLMDKLKGLFDPACRFGTQTQNVMTVQSDTGLVFIAPIPVCFIEKNWKQLDGN